MFRKLLTATVVLISSSSLAFAATEKNNKTDNTDDTATTTPAATPCPTENYTYTTGPYVGASASIRNNMTGTPTFYKGLEGTIFGGYGAMMSPKVYIAAEVFAGDSANFKDFKAELDPDDGVRSNWGWGFSVIPGYMVTDHVLGYFRLGGTWTQFNDSSDHPAQHIGAWQIGVGGQTNVYQNWDLRAEYTYSGYATLKDRGHVKTDLFSVGVIYKFV